MDKYLGDYVNQKGVIVSFLNFKLFTQFSLFCFFREKHSMSKCKKNIKEAKKTNNMIKFM